MRGPCRGLPPEPVLGVEGLVPGGWDELPLKVGPGRMREGQDSGKCLGWENEPAL